MSRASDGTAGVSLDAFGKLVGARRDINRGQTIADARTFKKCLYVLTKGIACLAFRHLDGNRQVQLFYYAGDVLGLHAFLSPDPTQNGQLQAVTDCSIGMLEKDKLDQAVEGDVQLQRFMWQVAMREATLLRKQLVISRRPALERVAHFLCEQLLRSGIDRGPIPLSQIDVADATALSVVHVNRVFQELRAVGVLSARGIAIVNRQKLEEIGGFNSRYLTSPAPNWALE